MSAGRRHAAARCHLVTGDEPLLQQEACDAVRAEARADGFVDREVITLAGAHADWSAVRALAAERSLFANQRLLELRLASAKPSKEGAEVLLALAQSDDPDTRVLIQMPRIDRSGQQAAWFQAIQRHGRVIPADSIDRKQLPAWLAQRLGQAGLHLPEGPAGHRALLVFAQRVEGNLLAAHQEIEKLALLHAGPNPVVLTPDQVETAVLDVARYSPFQLAEAALAGQRARTLRLLAGLEADGTSEVLAHWVLAEDIRLLHRLYVAVESGTALAQALREQRVWGNRETAIGRRWRDWSLTELDALLHQAHACERVVKGLKVPGFPAHAWAAIQHLAMALCGPIHATPTQH